MLNRVIKAEKVEIVMEIQLMRRLHQVNAVFDFEVAKHTKFRDRSQPRIACSDLLGGGTFDMRLGLLNELFDVLLVAKGLNGNMYLLHGCDLDVYETGPSKYLSDEGPPIEMRGGI